MGLGLLDRLLAPLVLIFMIVGTAVGATTGDAIPRAFDQVQLKGVSFRQSSLPSSLLMVVYLTLIHSSFR
jgi:ACR3 family arsenite efflux pump ArsB